MDWVLAGGSITDPLGQFNLSGYIQVPGKTPQLKPLTMSDGSTYTEDHTESVNGGQAGHATFQYGLYNVYVSWNDNNTVTVCQAQQN